MTLSNIVLGELPLVFFTSIAQAAVGLSVVYALFAAHKEASHQKFGIVFLVLTLLGVIASMLHLGDMLHAPYMILRMFGFMQNGVWVPSWLPLEILGIGVMVLLGALIVLKRLLIAVYILPFAGVAMLFAMSNIYGSMQSTVPTWNFGLTFFLFIASAGLLGGLSFRAFFAESPKEIAVSSLFSLIGFMLFALALLLYTLHNAGVRVDGLESVFELMHGYYGCFVGSAIVLAGLALAFGLYRDLLPNCFSCTMPSKIAFIIALLSVMVSRIAFYGLMTTHSFIG